VHCLSRNQQGKREGRKRRGGVFVHRSKIEHDVDILALDRFRVLQNATHFNRNITTFSV